MERAWDRSCEKTGKGLINNTARAPILQKPDMEKQGCKLLYQHKLLRPA
jgi:hypothetical protein